MEKPSLFPRSAGVLPAFCSIVQCAFKKKKVPKIGLSPAPMGEYSMV